MINISALCCLISAALTLCAAFVLHFCNSERMVEESALWSIWVIFCNSEMMVGFHWKAAWRECCICLLFAMPRLSRPPLPLLCSSSVPLLCPALCPSCALLMLCHACVNHARCLYTFRGCCFAMLVPTIHEPLCNTRPPGKILYPSAVTGIQCDM